MKNCFPNGVLNSIFGAKMTHSNNSMENVHKEIKISGIIHEENILIFFIFSRWKSKS